MWRYKVIHDFADLQDGNRIYKVGDYYDHENASKERIEELKTSKNKIGVPLIKAERKKKEQ